jgi:hypothetical protein
MPKLVITLIEISRPAPDNPEASIRGFETHIEGFYDDMPIEESILARLAAPIDAAINEVFHSVLGRPIHSGKGSLEQTDMEALAAAISKSAFPSELEITTIEGGF